MSGICGIIRFDGRPVMSGGVEVMADAAPHRSGDGYHEWSRPTVQVAHQAIHLTPESAMDDQPIVSVDGRHILVGAVRLDARDELVPQLRRRDLGGASDAVLVMAAFEKWGVDCAEHLTGDFAFVVVDTLGHSVFAARDPLGVRSLYYRLEPRKRLVFATEAVQILAAGGFPIEPFEPAIAAHLAGPYGEPQWSFYKGVEQLPGGCLLEVDDNGHGRVRRYWEVDPTARIRYGSEHEYAEHFRELFLRTVEDRLRTLGPLGIQLSGGMDSGSTASAAGHTAKSLGLDPSKIRTYSWAFNELVESDERSVSSRIVEAFGFSSVPVPADECWPLVDYPAHGPVGDDPFVLTYTAAGDATRSLAWNDGVKLLLVPERGDAVAGTPWVVDYARSLGAGGWRPFWGELREHRRFADDGSRLAIAGYAMRSLARHMKRRFLSGADRHDAGLAYPPWIQGSLASRTDLLDLILRQRKPSSTSAAERHRVIFSPVSQRWTTELERRHARAGLGFSDPFADRRIIEFVLAIPQVVINRPLGDSKRLLRASMSGVMPQVALRDAQKRVPESLFSRGIFDRGRSTIMDLTESMVSSKLGYVDERAARRAAELWSPDVPPSAFDPWWLLSLEWWLRSFWQG